MCAKRTSLKTYISLIGKEGKLQMHSYNYLYFAFHYLAAHFSLPITLKLMRVMAK